MYRVHLAAFPQVSGSKSQRRLANLSNRNRRDKCRTDGQVSPLQDHGLRKLHPLTAKVCAELLTELGGPTEKKVAAMKETGKKREDFLIDKAGAAPAKATKRRTKK